MNVRRSEHNPATDPPGAMSNQNREEQASEHRDDETHPEPRTTGKPPKEREPSGDRPGAAGEGSQSTGNPLNAG